MHQTPYCFEIACDKSTCSIALVGLQPAKPATSGRPEDERRLFEIGNAGDIVRRFASQRRGKTTKPTSSAILRATSTTMFVDFATRS